MAAVLACGPGAVLSHRSAAALHELRDSAGTKIDVTVPRRSGATTPASRSTARPRSPPPTSRSSTASPARPSPAPCSTSPRSSPSASSSGPSTRPRSPSGSTSRAIEDQLARNPTRPGAKAVRARPGRALHRQDAHRERERGGAAWRSPARSASPIRSANQWIDPRRRWPDRSGRTSSGATQRVIVETDSRKWHGTRQRLESTIRVRDQRLHCRPGGRSIRTTWRQMTRSGRTSCGRRSSSCGLRGDPPPSRAAPRLTSRCRRPSASATRHAARRRKHFICPATRPVSSISEVICTPSSPHGTIQLNGWRSFSTLTANPCMVTPRGDVHADRRDLAVADPDAGVVGPLVGPRPRGHALVGERRHQRVLQQSARTPRRRRRARSDSRRAGRDRGR